MLASLATEERYLHTLKMLVTSVCVQPDDIDKPNPNKLYFFEDRKTQIIHARLRNKCSSLNEHLYLTLSRTTNFRLFQTERVCRQQFQM